MQKNYEIENVLKLLREKGNELEEKRIQEYIKISFNHLSVIEQLLFNKQKQREKLKDDFIFYRQRVRTHKFYQKYITDNNLNIDGRDIIYITNDLRTVISLDGSNILELEEYSNDHNSGKIILDKSFLSSFTNKGFKKILIEGTRVEFKQINKEILINFINNSAKFKGMTNSIIFDLTEKEFEDIQINYINSWGMPNLKNIKRGKDEQ